MAFQEQVKKNFFKKGKTLSLNKQIPRMLEVLITGYDLDLILKT